MQSSILLIVTSGLFQQPAAPTIPEPSPTPVIAYYARLGPAPWAVAPVELPRPRFAVSDSVQGQRPKAREYSSGYYTRLAIHKYASYATLPLFAAEYVVGQKLFTDTTRRSGLRGVHSGLALGIGALFAVNTVTGVWNLWEQRSEPAGRARRYIHAALLLASDAGFLLTAATAPGGESRRTGTLSTAANRHRNLAIASFSTATVGYLMMLIWK